MTRRDVALVCVGAGGLAGGSHHQTGDLTHSSSTKVYFSAIRLSAPCVNHMAHIKQEATLRP